MRKVLVIDVAASSGGAMAVLKSFAEAASACKDIQWVFVLSGDYVPAGENVEIRQYPWIKRSHLHRMYFDYFVAPSIVRSEAPDYVLSLQNINIPFVKVKQVTYVHQSIPFSDLQFSIRKNPVEWLYQNVISRFICKSIRTSHAVVVQTQWMKQAVIAKTGIPADKLLVTPLAVITDPQVCYTADAAAQKQFFYPAAYASYKNHAVIVEAVRRLRSQGICDFKVTLTLAPGELPAALQAGENICCEGRLPFERVQQLYGSSILLFPSRLETFGLPLAEAAAAGCPIAAADLPYAREVLSGYENAEFFDPCDPEQLAFVMMRHIRGEYEYRQLDRDWFAKKYGCDGWQPLMQYLKEQV